MHMPPGIFSLTIVVAIFGMVGIWMIMKATDKIRKNYLLSKYPVQAKGIVNDKYTNKHDQSINKSDAAYIHYIKFSFCATDRNYATYTIIKKDHQMVSKSEWFEIKPGDTINVVYCSKDVTQFALASEQKMPRTRMIPIAIVIGSLPFFAALLIPLCVGETAATALAIIIALTGGMFMKLQRICCCDVFWKRCKRNTTVRSVISEVTTLTNEFEPELEVPSASETESLEYNETDRMNSQFTDSDDLMPISPTYDMH